MAAAAVMVVVVEWEGGFKGKVTLRKFWWWQSE